MTFAASGSLFLAVFPTCIQIAAGSFAGRSGFTVNHQEAHRLTGAPHRRGFALPHFDSFLLSRDAECGERYLDSTSFRAW